MLLAITGLQQCTVEGIDGRVGTVKDFLFDDHSWKVRWMVLDTGHWLPGRQILIHPSAIVPLDLNLPGRRVLPMMIWGDTLALSVLLTKRQIEASPEAREDEPVTKQMEARLCDYYGWAGDFRLRSGSGAKSDGTQTHVGWVEREMRNPDFASAPSRVRRDLEFRGAGF
jgi:hypothetical protein